MQPDSRDRPALEIREIEVTLGRIEAGVEAIRLHYEEAEAPIAHAERAAGSI